MTHFNWSHCYWTEFARLCREGCDAERARVGALAVADGEMMGLIDASLDFSIAGFNSHRKTRTYYHLQHSANRLAIRRQLEGGPFLAAFLAFDDTSPLPE